MAENNNLILYESKTEKMALDKVSSYHGFEEGEDLFLIDTFLDENVITFSSDGKLKKIPKR